MRQIKVGDATIECRCGEIQAADERRHFKGCEARDLFPDAGVPDPIPMLLWCPLCHARHVDRGEFATKPHHTHACQSCGLPWRPAIVPTVGVEFLPGFRDVAPA